MKKFFVLFLFLLFVSCDFMKDKYDNLNNPDIYKFDYRGHSYLRIKFYEYSITVLHDPDCACFNDSMVVR